MPNVIPSKVEGSKTDNIKLKIKMKKLFFIAAIAGVALASCTKNEVNTPAEKGKISFAAPVVSAVTKAPEDPEAPKGPVAGEINPSDKYPTDEEFNVFAVHHTGEYASAKGTTLYMEDVKVEYGDEDHNYWAPEHVDGGVAYYWPENADSYLTFAAYSPSDTEGDIEWTAANGFKLEDFVVEDLTVNQYDLMFSRRTFNKKNSTGGKSYEGVDINFEHALSSIVFKAKRAEEYAGTTIKLYSIAILNAYNKGTYEQGLVDDATNKSSEGYPKWTPTGDEKDYVVYNNTTPANIATGTTYDANDSDVIVLPQVFEREEAEGETAGANDVSIKVVYSIQTATGEEIKQEKIVSLQIGNGGTQFKDKENNLISAWEIGKRYTYTISFGLDKIYFSPEVETWTDVTINSNVAI